MGFIPLPWNIGDKITKSRLDRIEQGIADVDITVPGSPAAQAASTTYATLAGQSIAQNATYDALTASGASAADPTLTPFAASSPWRLGIATTAKFALDSDGRNATMSNVDGAGQAWINSFSFSHPIAQGENTDPLVTMTDTLHTTPAFIPAGGSWLERIPVNAVIAGGSDRHMHVFTPDRQAIIEHFNASKQSDTAWRCTRRHLVNLYGSGLGPQNGTRAYGGSAIGGLIRAWEVDPGHPAYTGEIRHPLAIALRSSQMLYTGKDPAGPYGDSYGADGYGLKHGYVWPASEQDYNSDTLYTGNIPMGAYFAIKPDVDLTTLGLTTVAGMMIAKALQDYGAYVTDTSGTSSFYIEDVRSAAPPPLVTPSVVGAWASSLKGSDLQGAELKRLFKALRVVTSNTASTPNGGRLTDPRRGVAEAVSAYPPIRVTPPINPSATPAYIDASSKPPVLKGWNGSAWVPLGGAASSIATTDNGDGTFTATGSGVTDNGDGTATYTDSTVTDNGDGTFTLTA